MATPPHDPAAPATGPRIGLGLAAVGRPGYINLGRDRDLPLGRGVDAMRRRTHELLDLAYERGVRHFDAARSYGRAEEFLASGWTPGPHGPVWSSPASGATPTPPTGRSPPRRTRSRTTAWRRTNGSSPRPGGCSATASTSTRCTRSPRTARPSPMPRCTARWPGRPRAASPSGCRPAGRAQGDAIRAALAVTVDGEPLFRSVQATWNLLEPSAGPALAEAHAAGRTVYVKEALANGRLAGAGSAARPRPRAARRGRRARRATRWRWPRSSHQPWAGVVLSGAATTAQLASNLRAVGGPPDADDLAALAGLAEPAAAYWSTRSRLPWN